MYLFNRELKPTAHEEFLELETFALRLADRTVNHAISQIKYANRSITVDDKRSLPFKEHEILKCGKRLVFTTTQTAARRIEDQISISVDYRKRFLTWRKQKCNSYVTNILWPTIGQFTAEIGHKKIEEFICTATSNTTLLYHTEFLKTISDESSDFYLYEVRIRENKIQNKL